MNLPCWLSTKAPCAWGVKPKWTCGDCKYNGTPEGYVMIKKNCPGCGKEKWLSGEGTVCTRCAKQKSDAPALGERMAEVVTTAPAVLPPSLLKLKELIEIREAAAEEHCRILVLVNSAEEDYKRADRAVKEAAAKL